MRRYCIKSIENMRDIGGYLAENKEISYGKIIRSNLPDNITEEDIKKLKEIGIKTVIDLRSREEMKKKKSVFEHDKFFKLFHYSVYGDGKIPNCSEEVSNSYMEMLEGKNIIYKIFKAMIEEQKGILYFCNAGKDRTGVITALIMMTLGVDRKDIIADYTLSNAYMIDKLRDFEAKSENKEIKEIIMPKIEYMEQFLEKFYQKYKSIDKYLAEIGIDSEDINKMKNKYLQ